MEKLSTLQKQLAVLKGGGTVAVDVTGLTVRDLTVGDEGEDVKALQTLLIAQGIRYPRRSNRILRIAD
jgi:hypothetical protein